MKKFIFLLLLIPALQQAQVGLNITSYYFNTSGTKAQYYSSNGTTVNTLTDSIEVQQVCYNTDTIYVRTNIMAEYIMGPWPGDPFIAGGQDNSYIFPRNPTYPSSTHQTKPTGAMGLLLDGVIIFDDGDGKSYNTSTGTNSNSGAGVWNQIAWVAHASELDAGNCHPDPSKIYHNHANPKKLCDLTTGTSHSPIVGWAFDGWPIYGPFGYSTATDASSSIKRMTSSWALRNITTRTTLYTGASTSQTGPAVSTSFPLGTYIEDYGYTASSGDLDYYNGRYCVTPEYPSGTYAYFLNTDASGNASYPNMIGPKYYGSVFLKNFGTSSGAASAPKIGVSCYSPSSVLSVSLSGSTNNTCNGSSAGSATVVASGGTSYSYSWSPSGGTAAIASSLAAGTYTCTVTSGTSTATQTVTITQPTAITPSVTSTSITCNGSSTGSATVSASGGTGSYTYSWSPSGGTSATASSLAAATYTCTIKDANLCSKTQTVTISQPTAITPSVISTSITCNGSATGSATVSASGGTGSYTYSWSPSGGTSATASSLAAATYTCTIKDANLCSKTQTVTISQPTAIATSAASTSITCNGSSTGAATVTASGGTGSLSYSWSPSGGTSSNASSLAAGTYSCVVTDANSCTKTQTVTISQAAAITVSVSAQTNVLCNGNSTGAATVSASGGTGSYTYSWSPSGGTSASASSLAAAAYTCTIKDANLCSKTQTITITQPTAISTSISSTSITCNGNSTGAATITASGGTGSLTYSWSPSGGTSATASSLAAATYTCKVTDGNSCTQTQTVTISQPAAISSSATSSSVTCNGSSTGAATVTASGGTGSLTYSWSPSGGTSATASSLAAATYTCTIKDANLCSKTQTVTIAQPTAMTVSLSSQTNVLCNGNSSGAATISASGGTGSLTYSWLPGGGTAASATNLAAGTYTCLVTDGNSCTKTQTVTITQPATAISSSISSASVACNGSSTGSATVTASGGTGSLTFSWSPSGGTSATASSLAAGTYTCTIKDANLCSGTQTITIAQPATAMSLSATFTSSACGGSNGAIDLTVSGGTPGYTYVWSTSATTEDISGLNAGSYTVTVTDGNNCTSTKITSVSNTGGPTLSASTTSLSCNGAMSGSIDLTVSGGTPGYTYSWSNGATVEDISSLAGGTYTVMVTDAGTCVTYTVVTVDEPAAISASNVVTNVLCNGGSTGAIDVTASGGTAGYTYLWSNSATTQDLTSVGAGTYTLTVTDAHSCGNTFTITVTEPVVLAANAVPTNVLCNGGSTGSIDLTVSGGTSAYTYAWSNNANTEDISSVGAGNYSVTITDANACVTTVTVTVTEPLVISVTNTVTNEVAGNDGAIDITVTGGTGAYTYAWSNSATTEDISGLTAGTYTVIVTDANNCTTTVTITVSSSTGIANAKGSITTSLYPNPAIGFVNVTSSKTPERIEVYNVQGQLVYTSSANVNGFDVSEFKQGVYTVFVIFKTNVEVKKLMRAQ